MKQTILIFLIATLLIPEVGITQNKSNIIKSKYLGSYYKDNYIWGIAMNLCWNNLCDSLVGEDLKLNTLDSSALKTCNNLNNRFFTKKDIDVASYYIKSGFGQKTVDEINIESKIKFPSKSLADLDVLLRPIDFISYAFFLKELEYPVQFRDTSVKFNRKPVKGFYARNLEQRRNIKIIEYKNPDKFIITLILTDKTDQLILAKGYDMSIPDHILLKIEECSSKEYKSMHNDDVFEMPMLNLKYKRDYVEMKGKKIANIGFEEYVIGAMYEKFNFNIDSKGARVENEAVIIGFGSNRQAKTKYLRLDKPFWIIMKQTGSKNPYFILGVNNTDLMEVIEE